MWVGVDKLRKNEAAGQNDQKYCTGGKNGAQKKGRIPILKKLTQSLEDTTQESASPPLTGRISKLTSMAQKPRRRGG